jgi:NAD(P)-dependent dehydrogenase (short-subunit alcohol dehydrogenase family)
VVRSYVVTGGGRGIGRAVAGRLLIDGVAVVVIAGDADAAAWAGGHPAGARLAAVAGRLSGEARFVTGAVLPVDGRRSAQRLDPEEA